MRFENRDDMDLDNIISQTLQKKLAELNGAVERMSDNDLRDKLQAQGLSTKGNRKVLLHRLKEFFKNSADVRLENIQKDHLKFYRNHESFIQFLILFDMDNLEDDVENKTERKLKMSAALLDEQRELVARFEFVSDSKTISVHDCVLQEKKRTIVKSFSDGYNSFIDWLCKYIPQSATYSFVTYGKYALEFNLRQMMKENNLQYPFFMTRYVDLQKFASRKYKITFNDLDTLLKTLDCKIISCDSSSGRISNLITVVRYFKNERFHLEMNREVDESLLDNSI